MPSTYVSLHYHFVFSTKERYPWIAADWRERLHAYIGGCIKSLEGTPLDVGGVGDHVHILTGLKATHCVADVLRDIKQMSSRWVHDVLDVQKFAWQEGYGGFTVSKSNCVSVARYIRGQEKHHRRVTFQEEFRELLEKHEIEFDERYLW